MLRKRIRNSEILHLGFHTKDKKYHKFCDLVLHNGEHITVFKCT